jgi:hypothetical protein
MADEAIGQAGYNQLSEQARPVKEDATLKRLRIRSIVASSAVTIALAAGTAYAATDAGSSLGLWYEARSQQLQDHLHDSVYEPGMAQAATTLESRSAELSEEAISVLSQHADAILGDNESSIQDVGSQYVNEADAAAQSAAAAMQLEFDAFVTSTSLAQAEELEQLVIDTIDELTEQMDTE